MCCRSTVLLLDWWGQSLAVTDTLSLSFYPTPQVDSFWQAQAVLMLTPRMPLYIPCVYNVFMYWSNVAATNTFFQQPSDKSDGGDDDDDDDDAADAGAEDYFEGDSGEFAGLSDVSKRLAKEFDAAESELREAIDAVQSGAMDARDAPRDTPCAFCKWTSSDAVAEASLAALLGAVLYAPYDLCGARFLWWTWHLDDAGVRMRWATHGSWEKPLGGVPAGSTAWTMIFGFWFAYLLRVSEQKRWSALTSLLFVATLATPAMMSTMTPLCAVVFDRLGEPSAATLLLSIVLFGSAVVAKVRRDGTKDKEKSPSSNAFAPTPSIVRITIVLFFASLFALVVVAKPEEQISLGVHQMWGPCDANDVDMIGYKRAKFACADATKVRLHSALRTLSNLSFAHTAPSAPLRSFHLQTRATHQPSEYLALECTDAIANAAKRHPSTTPLPAAVRPADATDEAKQWYTVCGVADNDAAVGTEGRKMIALVWVAVLGALGSAAYSWALSTAATRRAVLGKRKSV